MEYERRFRLMELPQGLSGPSVIIRQVYWPLGDGWVMRLRRTGPSELQDDEIAIKGPRSGFVRDELEFPLRSANGAHSSTELSRIASELFRAGAGQQVVKTRHSALDAAGQAWDIDEFHHANAGLIIAEIERGTALGIASISLPEWASEEVTSERAFDNERLALRPISTWADL